MGACSVAYKRNGRKRSGKTVDSVNRKAAMYSKPKQNRFAIFSIVIVVAMLIAVMAVDGSSLVKKKMANEEKIESIQEQIDKEKQRADELVEYEKYTKTKKFAEEIAKQKLGLVHEGEIIFRQNEQR